MMRPLAKLLITMIVTAMLAMLAIDLVVDALYPPGQMPVPNAPRIPERSVDHN